MERFYNNSAWRRIRGLRGLGILALSVAFCLTGLLVLSSCDLDLFDDDDESAPEAMEMRGFFTSVDYDNEGNRDLCSTEDVDVFLEGDESTGKLDVTIVGAGDEFGEAEFKHVGQKVISNDGKTIVTAYVTDDGGSFAHPGSYYLASTTNADIADGETIFSGYWVGHLYRPSDHPVVICPYVLVPRTAIEIADSGCSQATNADNVHAGLQEYLTQDDGSGGTELRRCYNVFDDDNKVSPMQR